MADYTRELCDDILMHIISFLTLRDAVRARLVSSKWKYFLDSRCILQFDPYNITGKSRQALNSESSYFVKAVDQFLKVWRGQRISILQVDFCLGKEHSSHIDRWIAAGIRMQVEQIDLNFSSPNKSFRVNNNETYVFPVHLLVSSSKNNTTWYLKRMRLNYCMLRLSSSSRCTSWLSHLTKLHLSFVPLLQSDIDCILSSALNLTSLKLVHCTPVYAIRMHLQLLLSLKELVLYGILQELKLLNCPNLQVFECFGKASNLILDHVPLLRKVDMLGGDYRKGVCSLVFDHLTRQAPQLEALSLCILTEVKPIDLASNLKQLDLFLVVPYGFDLLNITCFVNASPFLETLRIKIGRYTFTKQSPKIEYRDSLHYHLKEIRIMSFVSRWNEMDLALYFLRNAVALERMIIEATSSTAKQRAITTLLDQKKINPTAQVIICDHINIYTKPK